MLEIKPFDAWSETNAATEPSEKISQYADYVRTNAYKNGQMNDDTERDIQEGSMARAVQDGIISADDDETTVNQKMQSILSPAQNQDADAKFLLDHYQNDFSPNSPEVTEKAPVLQRYLSLKQISPSGAAELQDTVNGYTSDSESVKSARLAAVDRGDYRVIAVNEAGGRQLYTGADAHPENLNGELDSLISNGAISPSDLRDVHHLMSPINGGKSTVAEGTRYNVFADALDRQAKTDPNLKTSLDNDAAKIREAKKAEQQTTGESIFEGVKSIVATPFDWVAKQVTDVFGMTHPEEPVAPSSDLVGSNKAITDRFSTKEVNQFLGDYLKHASGPVYRADRPETGIDTDSLGNPIVSAALVSNKEEFGKALAASTLNDDQKERATIQRTAMLETEAPKILRLILNENSDAVSALATSRASGKPDSDFIESWVGNHANYSGLSERLQQIGMSTFSAVATLPIGIGALMGIEPAAKALVALSKDQSDREEYSRLFGDEFGLTFQLLNTVPQVATDVIATIGTGATYAGAKSLLTGGVRAVVKGGTKAVLRGATQSAMAMVDGAAAVVAKEAAKAGGEALVSDAFKAVGTNLASKLVTVENLAPTFAVSFTRSAASTYGSIYSQLDDKMSHDDKHRAAFGYAMASGLSTAIITAGMSALGHGGVEDLATGKFRPATAADDLATNVHKVPVNELNYKQAKFLYENLENSSVALTDKAFQKELLASIGGTYKNYLSHVVGGGLSEAFEESLDQAIQGRLEDAALHKDSPLSERINQIWTAGVLGGIMGGAHPAIEQIVKPLNVSEMSQALDARVSVLTKVADSLRKTGSTATAEVLQRQLNDAQSAAAAQKQADIAAQQKKEVTAKVEEPVSKVDKPITFDSVGQAQLDLGDTPAKQATELPQATQFLGDRIGERAYVGSNAGTIELSDDGSVRLALDEPMAHGVTHLNLGPKFQNVDKSIVRFDRKRILVTGESNGSIPSGTPYVSIPNTKIKLAFPIGAENVSYIPDLAGSPALQIKGARIIGSDTATAQILLTDKGQIGDALRYYNIPIEEISKPENAGQLELNLFDEKPVDVPAETPAPAPDSTVGDTAPPTKETVPAANGKKNKKVVDLGGVTPPTLVPTPAPISEEETAFLSLIKTNALASDILGNVNSVVSQEDLKKQFSGVDPTEFTDLKTLLQGYRADAMDMPDSSGNARSNILKHIDYLEGAAGRIRTLSFVNPKTATTISPNTAVSPTGETTPISEPTPVEPTPATKSKKEVKAKKVPVTLLPETTIVDNSENPTETAAKLQVELSELATTVPVIDTDGDTTTLGFLEDELMELEDKIGSAKEAGVSVTTEALDHLKNLRDNVKKARTVVDKESSRIKNTIKDITNPDPDIDTRTDEQIFADELLGIINGGAGPLPVAPEKAIVKSKFEEKKGVGPVEFDRKKYPQAPTPPIAVYKEGVFRNPMEAQLYTEWVAGGFMITNLTEHGFDSKKVSGIPFQSYGVDIKQRLFKAITDSYPLIPIAEGTATINSSDKVTKMDGSGYGTIKLPVILDPENKPITGVFTNDPITTLQQIYKGLKITIPKSVVNSKGFAINPSIITEPALGGTLLVKGVKRHLNDDGVYNAGDISRVGKSGYVPKKVMASLGNILIEPAAQFLEGAGPSARNKNNNTFDTYMSDMMSESGESGSRGGYEKRIQGAFYLKEDNARLAMSQAQIAYANSLKEYALGRKIEDRLSRAKQLNPSATVYDLNIPSIILEEATSKNNVTPPIKDVAAVIKQIYGKKKTTVSDKGVLTDYGVHLYDSVTSGDLSIGVKPFESQVFIYAKRLETAQGSRKSPIVNSGSLTQEQYKDVVSSFADPNSDIQEYSIRMLQRETLGKLTDLLRSEPVAYDLLFKMVSKETNISEDIEESELVDTAGRILRNYQLPARVKLVSNLQTSEEGLKLANLLIDANWLPPYEGKILMPKEARQLGIEIPALATNATKQQMADRVKLAIKAVNSFGEVNLSEGSGDMLADAARKVNNAEIKRLGIVDNDPASVIAALRDIQESGSPMQRLVAGVITANADLINNVRFNISDMNDVRFAGAFMPKSNLVMLNISGHNGRGVVDVLLHEYLHAVTVQTMTDPKTPSQVAALQRIAQLRELTAVQARKMGLDTEHFTEALSSDMEFITMALTAPEFQSLVRAATPTQQRSILSRIWESLRSLFGYATTDKKMADAFDELLDFTQMFAGSNTFNIKADRDLDLNSARIAEGLDTLREFAKNRAQLQKYGDVYLADSQTPITLVSDTQEIAKQLPEGMSLNLDSNLKGEAGVRRGQPDVIHVNPELLANRVAGLSESAAKAVIKGLVNHEIAHAAVLNEFTPEHITRVANELGEEQLQKIAEHYYSTAGLTHEETLAKVSEDRASGILSDSRIADEWIRMQVEKAVNGRTYEDVIRSTKGNKTLIGTIIDAIRAFVTGLRQRFVQYPSAETAASISIAERSFRKINQSGSIDFDANLYTEGKFDDSENLISSLSGNPVGDQTSYSVAVISSNPDRIAKMHEKLHLYNLPKGLRDIISMRSGTINTIATPVADLVKKFPQLRDLALKGGVDMEDIKLLFGTTAPPLTDTDLKVISDKTVAYEATLPADTDEGHKADLAAEYSDKLKREQRLLFNSEFVKQQTAAKDRIRAAGFGMLVDKAESFRSNINTFQEELKFDDSNDVYLTRAYKYFNTTGWSIAAKEGGVIKIDGKDVDFNKLREHAAEAYHEESEAELQKTGKPYTNKDIGDMTIGKLDRYLSTLESMSDAVDKQTVDSIRKDLNRYKPKKDIDSTFRELLGEIEDPLANAVNTMYRVGMLAANDKFRKDFAKTAIDLGLASKTEKAGWVTSFSSSSQKTTGDLAGLYFDPRVAGVLSETFGANMRGMDSNSTTLMKGLGRTVMAVSGASIMAKTQFGMGYWPRNAIGGFVLSAAQGILLNPFSTRARQSLAESFRASYNNLPTEEDKKNNILRLIQLNVLNDQSQGRVVQDLIRGIISSPESELLDLISAVDEARATKDAGGAMARLKESGLLKGSLAAAYGKFTKVTDFLAALDGAVDGIFKANAYHYELDYINKHHGDSLSVEAKEEAAARKVKLTFAGQSQVIDAVKAFNKTPAAMIFMPFARWKSEVFRTMLNTVPLAMEEINQGGVMTRRGIQRLAGFTGTLTAGGTIISALATAAFKTLTGGDDEEERALTPQELAALRESLPQWQRGANLNARLLKGGKVQFIDMSYILPHSQLTDAVGIITEAMQTGDSKNIGSRLASYVTGDLIGTQIAATAVDEIINNTDSQGQPIYVETDNSARKMQLMLTHYAKQALIPGLYSKPAEALRAGQTDGSSVIWGEILGARPKTVTFGDVQRRGFRNLKGLLDNSVSIIGELTGGRYKSDSDVDGVVDRHQDALNETQRRLSKFMHSMETMGAPVSDIYSSAKMYKFSDDTISSAYQGYRISWRPNDKWNQKTYYNVSQAKEQDPMERINSINRSVSRKAALNYINDVSDQ